MCYNTQIRKVQEIDTMLAETRILIENRESDYFEKYPEQLRIFREALEQNLENKEISNKALEKTTKLVREVFATIYQNEPEQLYFDW